MNYQQLKQSLEPGACYPGLADIVDYIESCCVENREINGDSLVLFDSLEHLVETYLDEIKLIPEALAKVFDGCTERPEIMALVRFQPHGVKMGPYI